MSTIDLPLIGPETLVQEALDQMRAAGRCGVVIQLADASVLLSARQLLEARDSAIRTVGEIPDGVPVMEARNIEVGAGPFDLVEPNRTPQAYENLFRSITNRYILTSVQPKTNLKTAMIVTAHETLASMLSGLGPYQCNGKKPNGRPHYFPDPSVTDGENCPLWPECNIDGTHTVVSLI